MFLHALSCVKLLSITMMMPKIMMLNVMMFSLIMVNKIMLRMMMLRMMFFMHNMKVFRIRNHYGDVRVSPNHVVDLLILLC